MLYQQSYPLQLRTLEPMPTAENIVLGEKKIQDIAPAVLDATTGQTGNPTVTTTYDYVGNVMNITVQNTYDQVGNRLSVIDGKNQTTAFTYDGLNRNLTVTYGAGTGSANTTTYTFDQINKVSRLDPNGQTTSYAYDLRNRLLTDKLSRK